MTSFAPEQYKETLLFLGTAGLVVPLFRRLKVSPILGFLSAGAVLGPYGLGAVAHRVGALSFLALDDVEAIAPVAEFGVVFLLFMIGLELSWARLARMRRLVFGLGALQVCGSAAVIGALAIALREGATSALVLGFALALSSTAIVIPVLAERRRLGTSAGRTIFSVLLFQDLMVAPLVFMMSVVGTHGGGLGTLLLYTLAPALAGLTLLVVGGRLVMRPLFHHVAAAGSTEFFMAACLLVVIGTGVLTALSGLSMGLGAFIAGLLLAETEYRREIEVTIEPFKGLLLGLFFVSIGASLDLSRVVDAPARALGLAVGFVAAKAAVVWLAARLMRLPARVATEAALMLGPGGEFAFVMLAVAVASNAVSASIAADAEIAVTLSMFLLPVLGALAPKLLRQPAVAAPELELPQGLAGGDRQDAIIIGYGRVGQLVGEMLRAHAIPFIAIDSDPNLVKKARADTVEIYWGNASRLDFLERCGLATARAVILTMDAPAAAEAIVEIVHAARPDATIVARARDAQHATRLYKLGVTDAVPETIEASLQLSEAVLVDIGVPMGLVIASIHEKRDAYRKLLQPTGDAAREKHGLKFSQRRKEALKPKLRRTEPDNKVL